MKNSQLFYVTRNMYELLLSKDFSIEDLLAILERKTVSKRLSLMTVGILEQTDSKIKQVIFRHSHSAAVRSHAHGLLSQPLSDKEREYVNDEVDRYLLTYNNDYNDCSPEQSEEDTKCYEIVTRSTPDTVNLVIVVDKGFLSLVTTNPEKLICFHREIIRHLFDNEACSFMSNDEYLGLKMNPGYFDLVKLSLTVKLAK